MKKLFFLFAMFVNVAASATVTVTPLSVDYAAKKVTFSVSWTGSPVNNRVWVWIDLSPITGTSPGTFEKAVISGATATVGSIDAGTLNGRGFYVTTSPSTVTATLSNAADKFNWCVYGSDAPPNAASYSSGTYTLKGTQPFTITGNGTIQDGNKYVGTNIISLTDATGCPGGIGRDVEHNGEVCLPHLTPVGSYCRDLADDGASANTSCNIEVKISDVTYATGCPNGWSIATRDQMECMRSDKTAFNLTAEFYFANTTYTKGHVLNVSYCTNCSCYWFFITNPALRNDHCGAGCNHYCVNNYLYGYPDGMATANTKAGVKCIR